jgi:asparagine synthase (glutamine-hydrolysing)
VCGIAGKVHADRGRPVEEALLRRMAAALAHRGPDDEQAWAAGRAGLALRRLAIIDLGGGRQPMANEDRSVWLVFNGEIYNYRELRAELLAAGHAFRTRSDTEVILHLYEELGAGCLPRLRGMFALAVWDGRRERLLLARDRLGKKPLVYACLPDGLSFASELGALLQDPAVDRALDPAALDAYLRCQAIPSPRTIYRAVRKLPPGHALVWENGTTRVERYWALRFGPETREPAPEIRRRVRELLEESVRVRLESEVPLGVLLSGGIDSTAVAALMARELGRPVQTFSVGFEEAGYSELPQARRLAEAIGAEHHEAIVKPDVAEALLVLARHYGEPFADKSAVPTYCVARMAGRALTVALSGDGGDEAFAGYPRYLAGPAAGWLPGGPAGRRRLADGLLGRALSLESGPLAGRLARRGLEALAPPARSVLFPEFFPGYRLRELYREEVRRAVGAAWAEEILARWRALPAELGDLEAALALDYGLYLPETLLVKLDIASMANSLEVRCPFLDHVLVEYAARIPGGLKAAGATGKALLREVVRDLLPPEILRGPKRGFSAPVGAWLRGRLRAYAAHLLVERPRGLPEFFRPGAVRALWEAHQSGRANHAMRLWALLVFEVWFRTWMDGPAPGGTDVA